MNSPSPRTRNALVIGEALIDIVERVDSGEDPAEVVGGSPANVALGLSRLGVEATLLTHVAHDERGERIARSLRTEGVRIGEESFSARRTTTAHALIAEDGAATYTFDISWDLQTPDRLGAELVHAGSLGLFLEPGATAVESLLAAADPDAVVSLDPNIRPNLLPQHGEAVARFERLVRGAHVVKLSDEDAAWLYPGLSMPEVAGHLRGLGPVLVVVTLGAHGALAQVPALQQPPQGHQVPGAEQEIHAVGHGTDDVVVRVPIRPGPLVDTISAGDSFMASLLASVLTDGLDACVAHIEATLRRASCASAIAVSKGGANPPTLAALDALEAGDDSVLR